LNNEKYIGEALSQFEKLLRNQLNRAEAMKSAQAPKDFSSLETITIGLVGGDESILIQVDHHHLRLALCVGNARR